MPLDLSRIKALCFDVDGTLSDTDDAWVERLNRLLTPFRILFPKRDARPFARWTVMATETPGNLAYNLLDWIDLDDDLARMYEFMARRRARTQPHNFWLIAGIGETLAYLSQHYPMSIVSARDEAGTLAFLDHFNLRGYFQAVAASQTCRHTKPYPDPVLWTARRMSIAPSQCLMIGDTTVDILAGKAAGAQTVGVLCGFGDERELHRAGADLVLPTTSDLQRILSGAE